MKKVLLIYSPFCTPASPPYSITNLYSFLKHNSQFNLEVLDLNLEFHKRKFPQFQKFFQDQSQWRNYKKVSEEYQKLTKTVYSKDNKRVVEGETPEYFSELLQMINEKDPDIIVFSIVYSSQAFFAHSFIRKLKDKITIIGGPAVNEKLSSIATFSLKNEVELLEKISGKKADMEKLDCSYALDFSIYDLGEYFTPKAVLPLKTSSSCYYKKCTFCNHHGNAPYEEYPLECIRSTITNSKQKLFFLIDDMMPKKRLLSIARCFKELGIKWSCQLRPIKEYDLETLKELKESGLCMIIWGVESANERILGLINKGTNKQDIENVLRQSSKAGIKNTVYILFGFPSEKNDEFLETIGFLKDNEECIDLISTSVFGLQKGTEVFVNPGKFGITNVREESRTILEPKISYEVNAGLSKNEAIKLRDSYMKTIEKINKYPKAMNFFREHMICLINEER